MRWTPATLLAAVLLVARPASAECRQDCARAERDARGCCVCIQACPRHQRDARGCCVKAAPASTPAQGEWVAIGVAARRKLSVLKQDVSTRQYTACVRAGACGANESGWRAAERYCRWRDARLPTWGEAAWLQRRESCTSKPDAGCELGRLTPAWVASEWPPHGTVIAFGQPRLVPAEGREAVTFRCVR